MGPSKYVYAFSDPNNEDSVDDITESTTAENRPINISTKQEKIKSSNEKEIKEREGRKKEGKKEDRTQNTRPLTLAELTHPSCSPA